VVVDDLRDLALAHSPENQKFMDDQIESRLLYLVIYSAGRNL
jgi:hypothetical protein